MLLKKLSMSQNAQFHVLMNRQHNMLIANKTAITMEFVSLTCPRRFSGLMTIPPTLLCTILDLQSKATLID